MKTTEKKYRLMIAAGNITYFEVFSKKQNLRFSFNKTTLVDILKFLLLNLKMFDTFSYISESLIQSGICEGKGRRRFLFFHVTNNFKEECQIKTYSKSIFYFSSKRFSSTKFLSYHTILYIIFLNKRKWGQRNHCSSRTVWIRCSQAVDRNTSGGRPRNLCEY